ncbi:MAG TPA: diacylglycerol kinase family protein [Candidatus Nanopelagicales bacterium]|nr:diacylglycerol kinase family protein [Candidatus Nanopelagicales bacterium]
MSASSAAPSFLVVAAGASRLADLVRRDALVATASAAIEARTGAAPEVRVTTTAAAGRAAAQEAVAASARLLVVAGGDGSVRTAAANLAGTGIALGIVPGGTGNLLAAALGIPRSPERAAVALATARERPIDLGRAWVGAQAENPVPFIVAVGIGFDARVMAATTDRRKRSLGIAAYFAAATAVAIRIRPFEVRLVVDGVVHETDALAVLVANAGELIPGLLRPRLPLIPDDGLLDVLVARGRGMAGGSRAALELLLGRGIHTAIGPYAARFAGRHVEVDAPADEPVEVDGDVVGAGRLVAEVVEGAVRILVPA